MLHGETISSPSKERAFMIIGGLSDFDDAVHLAQIYGEEAIPTPGWDPEAIEPGPTIYFEPRDAQELHTPHADPLVVDVNMHNNLNVPKVLIDTGSNVNIIFVETLRKMKVDEDEIRPSAESLTDFSGNHPHAIGTIRLTVSAAGIPKVTKFIVVNSPRIYNAILGTPWIHAVKGVVSTYHQCMKFPTPAGIFTLRGNQQVARSCNLIERRMRTASACLKNEEMDPRLPYH